MRCNRQTKLCNFIFGKPVFLNFYSFFSLSQSKLIIVGDGFEKEQLEPWYPRGVNAFKFFLLKDPVLSGTV